MVFVGENLKICRQKPHNNISGKFGEFGQKSFKNLLAATRML